MSDLWIGVLVFVTGSLMHGGFWCELPRIKEGAVRGQHGEIFFRKEDPARFWVYVGIHVFGAFLGLFMMFWGVIGIGVGLGILE